MAQIDIRKSFTALAPQQVRLKAEEVAQNLSGEYGLEWKWASPTRIEFTGTKWPSKGVSGSLTVEGSSVALLISMPDMLHAMLGKKIEAEARSFIDAIDRGR